MKAMRLLLIILCVLLLGLIFYQIQYYSNAMEPQSSQIVQSSGDVIDYDVNEIKPLPAYEEIIQRPLFSINRKAPKITEKTIDSSINVEELERLVVFGIVMSGDISYAILGNMDGEQESRQVKEGFNYKGWQVSEIGSNSVKFIADDVEYELSIAPNDLNNGSAFRRTNNKEPINDKKNSNKSVTSSNQNINDATNSASQGLIYNRSKKKSPIKIPSSNQLGNQKPLSDEQIKELQEQGGYSFDIDEAFDEDFYED